MNKRAILYYGDQNCTIECSDLIGGIQIWYKGAIQIIDKTPDNFEIFIKKNMILIIPTMQIEYVGLKDLFSYKGYFKVQRLIVSNPIGIEMPSFAKEMADYAEMLGVSENISTRSEDLNKGKEYQNRLKKSSVNTPVIKGLNTKTHDVELFLSDGTPYHGDFHFHKKDMACMTGGTHTDASETLYYYSDNDLLPVNTAGRGNKLLRRRKSKRRIAEGAGGKRRRKQSKKFKRKNKFIVSKDKY